MRIDGLLHVNIRCSANDLPAIEKFLRRSIPDSQVHTSRLEKTCLVPINRI